GSPLLVVATEVGPSCGEGDGNLTNAWCGCRWNGFTPRGHVFKNKANGVLSHGKSFRLIVAVGDDLRERGDADGKAAFLFWFKNNGELARLTDHDFPLVPDESAGRSGRI